MDALCPALKKHSMFPDNRDAAMRHPGIEGRRAPLAGGIRRRFANVFAAELKNEGVKDPSAPA